MNGVSHALKDIRPMANERARKRAEEAQGNPTDRPPGNGFMTERAKAKEALRAEVNTYRKLFLGGRCANRLSEQKNE